MALTAFRFAILEMAIAPSLLPILLVTSFYFALAPLALAVFVLVASILAVSFAFMIAMKAGPIALRMVETRPLEDPEFVSIVAEAARWVGVKPPRLRLAYRTDSSIVRTIHRFFDHRTREPTQAESGFPQDRYPTRACAHKGSAAKGSNGLIQCTPHLLSSKEGFSRIGGSVKLVFAS